MARLVGTHQARIDQKGRLTLPAPVRPALGGTVVLTAGMDPCVVVYPESTWQVIEESILARKQFGEDERWWRRAMGEAAEERSVDDQGRVLVGDRLRTGCELGRDVLVLGALDRLEIWDPATYEAARSAKVTPEWIQAMGERH
ncbi:MAG: cell division/cell wall cluster transcriptional repressor MraZ [Armatimonadia bacterium]|nr:cell division/cell wall cluster transcriptional repressor MraZ [Armatimonadia bacterium]